MTWREFKWVVFGLPILVFRSIDIKTIFMQKYCISVDWLEVCCYGNDLSVTEFTLDGKHYEVVEEERQTAFFKKFFIIKHHGLDYAYIRREPRLSRVNRGLTCLKLANRVLYHEDYIKLLLGFIKALRLNYKGFTRLDLAYDCNRFYDGRKPHKFIMDYVHKPLSEKGGMYLANCKEFSIHGRKSIGNDGQINYFAFGAKSCQKRGYIYNKSLELKEVKDKPWIRDMWERNGLKNDDKNQVWRAEISIKCEGKDLLNLETGQLFPLNPNYISTYENIKKIFHFYAAKVFDFRINEGQKNRRNYSRLNIFDTTIAVTCMPKRVSRSCDSGRSEKICRNKLEKLSTTYVDLSDSVRSSLYAAMEWIGSLSAIKQARYKAEQYKHYLDTFAATKFISEEEFAYLAACEDARESRSEADEAILYQRYLEFRVSRAFDDEY